MIIHQVDIVNFLAIGQAQVTLERRGLLLVQGENRDDSSAISNGAGKSSVGDAIFWCLYGETARGVSGDSVVNRKAKKGCVVQVILKDGDDTYTVVRNRKHPVNKNILQVFKAGVGDLTKGTDKETQALLVQILGASIDVFKAAVYSGQEQMPDLPGMTDKELKLLVEEAAGITVLQDAYEIARSEALAVKGEVGMAHLRLENAKQHHVRSQTAEMEAAERVSQWQNGQSERVSNAWAAVKDKLAQSDLLAETHNNNVASGALKPPKVTGEQIAAYEARLAAIKGEAVELARLNAVLASASRKVATLEAMHKANLAALKNSKAHAETVDDKVGTPCGECGKPFTADDIEAVKGLACNRLHEAARVASLSKRELEAAVVDANEHTKARDAYASSMTDASEATGQLKAWVAERDKYAASDDELATMLTEIKRATADANRIQGEENPHLAAAAAAERATALAAADVARQAKIHEKMLDSEALANRAVEVFSPAGVRAHILDSVTPYLNDRTARYLGSLADGNITAVWSTLTRTAKGELREKFNIEVTNVHGADSFAGLSGGEKRKVRLGCALALQDLVASRATKPIDLWIGDEIDDALDEGGLERLMGILEDKARERGTVMVISHNSLTDWIRQSIVVVKEGGASTISEGI